MSPKQIYTAQRYSVSLLITISVIYVFGAFTAWDAAWLSDINQWEPYSRFFLLIETILSAGLVFIILFARKLMDMK